MLANLVSLGPVEAWESCGLGDVGSAQSTVVGKPNCLRSAEGPGRADQEAAIERPIWRDFATARIVPQPSPPAERMPLLRTDETQELPMTRQITKDRTLCMSLRLFQPVAVQPRVQTLLRQQPDGRVGAGARPANVAARRFRAGRTLCRAGTARALSWRLISDVNRLTQSKG